jgi:serine/threonine protein kinase
VYRSGDDYYTVLQYVADKDLMYTLDDYPRDRSDERTGKLLFESPVCAPHVLRTMVTSMLLGLRELRGAGRLIHRDLKPENVVCNESGGEKLTK